MEKIILAVISELKPEYEIDISQDLIGTGVLDSFDLLVLVSELEVTTGLNIPGICLTPENFFSVESIACLMDSLKSNNNAS